ncbi:MAG: thiamine biosynthesis protein ApbE [Flavobacteriales bacterium]|nr:MAG: thiamine biosynthesis protein ApbE [Flavobacteriales bacterium]
MKNCIHTILVFLLLGCGSPGKKEIKAVKLQGETQGTTYHITYIDPYMWGFQQEIDSILKEIDQSLSTYIESSVISNFNKADTMSQIDRHVLRVFWKSKEIHHYTNGAFDPTVKPLINIWGFGGEKVIMLETLDSALIDSMHKFIGLEKVQLYDKTKDKIIEYLGDKEFAPSEYYLVKSHPAIQLDFNAIAQGYTVDLIAEFLQKNEIANYLVEVGGEVRVKGSNTKGERWKIGIDKPQNEAEFGREIQAIVSLKNKSLATSGNYRKFYVKDGVKYSHTINPKTGFPVRHMPSLLSVTVLAMDCMTADGYATAMMAMGFEKSKKLLYANDWLEAYIIYDNEKGGWDTYITKKMRQVLEEQTE